MRRKGLKGLFSWLKNTVNRLFNRWKGKGLFGIVMDIVIDAINGDGYFLQGTELPPQVESQLEQWAVQTYEPFFDSIMQKINVNNPSQLISAQYVTVYNNSIRAIAEKKVLQDIEASKTSGNAQLLALEKSKAWETALQIFQGAYMEATKNLTSPYSFVVKTFVLNQGFTATNTSFFVYLLEDTNKSGIGTGVNHAGNPTRPGGASSGANFPTEGSGASAGGGVTTSTSYPTSIPPIGGTDQTGYETPPFNPSPTIPADEQQQYDKQNPNQKKNNARNALIAIGLFGLAVYALKD